MSYNLVDPVTGELTQVAGGIDTSIIPSDASASNKLATTDSTLKTIQLSGSVDCNTLTEPGLYIARAGAVVSALTNIPVELDSSAQINGGFSILVTASNTEGTFFGMQMFIPYGSDLPFIRKAYYFNGQYWTDWKELATMDKVVKDSGTVVETLYSNNTGDFLKSDMNLTATKSGILKVSFNKKETGNTFNIYINDVHKYAYPNWWGENVYETAYVPVNNGDEIRISTDVSEGGDWYRIVNVLII